MNLYFHFPEILDEDKKVINYFTEILITVKKHSDCNIYYSEDNLKKYKEINEELEVYLTSEIKIIRQFLNSQKVLKMKTVSTPTIYNRWNLDKYEVNSCEESLIIIAENLYKDPKYNYILLNLENGIETCRNKILVFRDCKYLDFPDHFVKIDYVVNNIEFEEWLKTSSIKEFSLKNEDKFQKKPSINVKGATVYYELENKRYWHLDTFHEYVEYEVYDSDGIHIATANEKGEIDIKGKKKGREITIS